MLGFQRMVTMMLLKQYFANLKKNVFQNSNENRQTQFLPYFFISFLKGYKIQDLNVHVSNLTLKF
jgi:hypothetical protein